MPQGDVREESYLTSRAKWVEAKLAARAAWETLHGDAGSAICQFVDTQRNAIITMSSHDRKGLPRAILGSVTGECVRESGVPVLILRTATRPSTSS